MFVSHGGILEEPSTTPNPIPLNQWTHLVITFDGTTKWLYVNGAQIAWQGALAYDPATPVTIGSALGGINNIPFNGRVDDVAIYNQALTADEVWTIYKADFLGKNVRQPYLTSPSQLPDVTVRCSVSQ